VGIRGRIPLVAVFKSGDFLLQIPRDTQAIRFYAFCQTKMSHFLNAFFSAQYPFFKRSQEGQKIPRSRKLGPAYPNAGANDGQPMARFTPRFPLCSLYVQSYAFYENVEKHDGFLYFFCFSLLFFPFVRDPCFFSPSQFFFLSLFYLSIS
jgi:hypothetical protein